jgi:hypothetical protein
VRGKQGSWREKWPVVSALNGNKLKLRYPVSMLGKRMPPEG